MSIIFDTTLSPSKYELLAAWLPTQPWFVGDVRQLSPVGAYRVDDPEGEVGFEGHLFTAGDACVYHVPLSYRGAPLDRGEQFLVGTMEHGVLGRRWASDAIGDPVFRAVLAAVIVQGGTGSREYLVDATGGEVECSPSVRVAGTGSPGLPVPELWAANVELEGSVSVARTDFAALEVHRILVPEHDESVDADRSWSLRGAWGDDLDGHRVGVLLAALRA